MRIGFACHMGILCVLHSDPHMMSASAMVLATVKRIITYRMQEKPNL